MKEVKNQIKIRDGEIIVIKRALSDYDKKI